MRALGLFAASAMVGLLAVVAGCANDRPDVIPSDALLLNDSQGQIATRAPGYGNVYVLDRDTSKLVYSGQVESGQMVEVRPDRDRISIAGKTVFENSLDDNHHYRVFFEQSPAVHEVTVEKQTTVEKMN